MAIKSEFGDDGFEIWDQWSSLSSAYRAIDARDVWKSIKAGKGIGIGSLFYDAKQAGWKDDAAYKKPSAAEIEQRRKERAERDALAAAQELADQEAAAVKAQELWAASTPCESHAYLERKGVKSHGLRYGRFDVTRIDQNTGEVTVVSLQALLMPIMDRSRKIWTLQAFSAKPDGRKSLLKNGRKSGNFFVIGSKPQMVDGRPVFILVEGYATGASVHEATGHMVMVCVDAGNLRNVARSIRERSPNAILVVAADNDTQTDGNPGLTEANKAAKESGCLVAYPPDGGDFNDLATEHGHTAVADVIQLALVSATSPAPEPSSEPPKDADPPAVQPSMPVEDEEFDSVDAAAHFAVLGYDGDDYWVFHHAKQQVLCRSRSHFASDTGLVELAPMNWWEMYFPAPGKAGGVNKAAAFEWFIALAHARGIYDPRRVRGRGAWNDKGRVVFHHGDHLSVDGKRVEISGMTGSSWVYPMSKSMPKPAANPVTDAEGQHLLNVAKMAKWSRPGSAPLLAGWVFLSPVCGALPWRPHIWITGAAGSGKSTLYEDYAQALLEGISEPLAGDSTEPGIRQSVGADAVPILIDEFEPNDEGDRKRMKSILTTVRQSSTETSAQTAKGTISGQGMRFHVRSMFCLASINTMLDKDSDRSRITPLVLRPPTKTATVDAQWVQLEDELHKIKRAGTWPSRLLARSLGMLPTILANVEVFCKAAALRFGTQRLGDQYGTLLAGAWCLTSGAVATEADALAMIDSYDWSEHKDGGDGLDDPAKALASVMEAKIRVSNTDITVYEMLAAASGRAVGSGTLEVDTCVDVLRRNGIRIKGGEALFGTGSKSLKKLVEDTAYATDIRGQLLRVQGANVANNATFKFAGVTSKVVAIPLSLILGDDEPPI